MCDCVVNVCGSKHCKTCKYVHECSTFHSNVTHKIYNIFSPNLSINCGTENIIYLESVVFSMWERRDRV